MGASTPAATKPAASLRRRLITRTCGPACQLMGNGQTHQASPEIRMGVSAVSITGTAVVLLF